MKNISSILADALKQAKSCTDGKNASYIPGLAKVPSELLGLAVVTKEGEIFQIGDSLYEFAIESISKVFTMALVMNQSGFEVIHQKIGADPTGAAFNSVIAIELHQGKPLSPLVNAGAMSSTSLVRAISQEDRWKQILDFYGDCANRKLSLNQEIYQSEDLTNQHNKGIAWLLKSYGYMYCDPEEACEVYTRQCSVNVTACDLATMAATIANHGINPISKQQVIHPENCPKIMAEMVMEGLYDSAGDWFFENGIPAKSGVGGGIIAAIPGFGGIAAFAPPLDSVGNSVRGMCGVSHIAQALQLNLLAK